MDIGFCHLSNSILFGGHPSVESEWFARAATSQVECLGLFVSHAGRHQPEKGLTSLPDPRS